MRRLVATLACRAGGSRLYGKPVQNLDIEKGVTILDHMISVLRTIHVADQIVLGISEGVENEIFVEVAARHGLDHIIGDQRDVLQRLIQCCEKGNGTDALRITTECPFFFWEGIEAAWKRHLETGNDITVTDRLPLGGHFEIYTLDSLKKSHDRGDDTHRSELCSKYAREHPSEFQIEVLEVPDNVRRMDLRLTVDYPEDLILCRRAYEHLKDSLPLIRLADVVEFVDAHPELHSLVRPYVFGKMLW